MSAANNEATKQVLRALLNMKELYGEDETIRLLEIELTRLHVLKERQSQQRALVPYEERQEGKSIVAADLAALVRPIEEALNFYANADNYAGAGRSQVQRDRGERARDALAKISGEDKGE